MKDMTAKKENHDLVVKALYKCLSRKERKALYQVLVTGDRRLLQSTTSGTIPRDEFRLLNERCLKVDLFGIAWLVLFPESTVGDISHRRQEILFEVSELVGDHKLNEFCVFLDITPLRDLLTYLTRCIIRIRRKKRRFSNTRMLLYRIGRMIRTGEIQ